MQVRPQLEAILKESNTTTAQQGMNARFTLLSWYAVLQLDRAPEIDKVLEKAAQSAFQTQFKETLIPAYENATQTLFKHISSKFDQALLNGIFFSFNNLTFQLLNATKNFYNK